MIFQNVLAAFFAVNSRLIAKRFKSATIPLNLIIYAVIATSGLTYALAHGISSVHFVLFRQYLGFFLFAGICFAVTNVLSYLVFEYVDAAIASLLSTLNIIAAVVLSTLLLREGLNWHQVIGAAVLLIGMEVILTINLTRYKHKRLLRAVLLSALASLFFALAITTEKYLLNKVNLSTYLFFGWTSQFVGVCALAILFGRAVKANFSLLRQSNFYRFAVPASLVRMYSGLLFIYSLKLSNNLSIISVLSGLKIILAALLAAYLLKERDYLTRKVEAAVLATVGIAIIYWK